MTGMVVTVFFTAKAATTRSADGSDLLHAGHLTD